MTIIFLHNYFEQWNCILTLSRVLWSNSPTWIFLWELWKRLQSLDPHFQQKYVPWGFDTQELSVLVDQVLGLDDANSTEFDSATPHPCVVFMPEVYISTHHFLSCGDTYWHPPERFYVWYLSSLLMMWRIMVHWPYLIINVLCPLCPLAITSVQFPTYLMEYFVIQVSKTHMGGTMRLGARKTLLQTADCITAKLYVEPLV